MLALLLRIQHILTSAIMTKMSWFYRVIPGKCNDSAFLRRPGPKPDHEHSGCIYVRLYTYVIPYYTYTASVAPLSGPQNQHFNYKIRATTLHKTSCIYIHFWQWLVSTQSGSTEASRGYGRVSHVFLGGWSACLSLIFCKFLVGALQQLAPPWLRAWPCPSELSIKVILMFGRSILVKGRTQQTYGTGVSDFPNTE
jgi:hypothetical protein